MLATAAIAAVLAGCSSTEPAQPAATAGAVTAPTPAGDEPTGLEPSEPYDVIAISLSDPDGQASERLQVYDAYTPEMRRFGLMERTELPPRAGMVFRYPDDRDGGFWMKNTRIPLSIAYYDGDGVVHTVLDMEPCEADPCPSYPPSAPYRGALEVNQGFYDEIGLVPGWRIELPPGLPQAFP